MLKRRLRAEVLGVETKRVAVTRITASAVVRPGFGRQRCWCELWCVSVRELSQFLGESPSSWVNLLGFETFVSFFLR